MEHPNAAAIVPFDISGATMAHNLIQAINYAIDIALVKLRGNAAYQAECAHSKKEDQKTSMIEDLVDLYAAELIQLRTKARVGMANGTLSASEEMHAFAQANRRARFIFDILEITYARFHKILQERITGVNLASQHPALRRSIKAQEKLNRQQALVAQAPANVEEFTDNLRTSFPEAEGLDVETPALVAPDLPINETFLEADPSDLAEGQPAETPTDAVNLTEAPAGEDDTFAPSLADLPVPDAERDTLAEELRAPAQ